MDYSLLQQHLQIKQLLEKFLQAKCPNKINVYLEKWLSHFWRQANADTQCSLLTLPVFTEWLVRAVSIWEQRSVTPPSVIASFALNLASLLSISEEKFRGLNNNNFFISLINVVKARDAEAAYCVKSSYIKLLSTFLEHKSGIQWITVGTLWEDIFTLNLLSQDLSIVTESTDFLSKLLDRIVDYDPCFCNDVIKLIVTSLSNKINKSEGYEANVKLIGSILQYFLDGILFDEKDFRVVLQFLKNFYLEERIITFITLQNQHLDLIFTKVVFIMQFLQLYLNIYLKNMSTEDINTSVQKLKKSYFMYLSKGSFDDLMDFVNFGCLFWRLFDAKIPPTVKTDNMTFSEHCICLLLAPSMFLVLRHYITISEFHNLMDTDDSRHFYMSIFFKRIEHDFLRVGYSWKNDFMVVPDLEQHALKGFTYLKESRKYFTKDGVLFLFHKIVCQLQDIIRAVTECPEKLESFMGEDYFSKLFELLAIFIEEFRITWKDNFETANVMAISFDFLMLTKWPSKVVVQVLNLINMSIRDFMAPNMALLVDTTENSTLDLLGTLLAAKLLDVSDIKGAALEVIYTMARTSGWKFPSLQKVLMDSELPTLVVKMSTCDSESFVRATAIKCLQEMIQVEEIWNNALKTEDLPQKMRDVLLNETEGIVRVEAATFMCVAYENQQLPKETLDRVYETMIYSSTTDLHWEVKVRALDFWDKVIKNHLQNQGMIDGSFPNVTFSKEHRKIVTLTDSEIRKRLLKVLSQLSSIGCLGVLMSAIKDDCDMEVSKTAAKISQGLVDLFKKYNVRSDGSTPTSPLPTENGMSTASVSSGVSVDESMDSPATNHHDLNEEIIDQIVNSKDICLLKNVYTPSDYGSVSNYDIQVRRIVTPNEFLQFTQQDLNSIINEKKNWLNGIEDLGSLLDDMLKTYDDDVNNMDCY